MIKEIIFVILLTFLPFLELRYSIPAGILAGKIMLPFGFYLVGFGLPWYIVFPTAVLANILIGAVVYFLLDAVIHLFLHIPWLEKIYDKTLDRAHKRIEKYVDKYGTIGVAIFIGIPFPGSGVYSGALGSHAIGLDFKGFMKAQTIGVLIAGLIVTMITLGVIAL
ncbi:small multi-drug export protein [Candidatus Woesearchaeota archaeon]|nr:small multi-drug export protein [Candidatus Woesearchaeota archaeon]